MKKTIILILILSIFIISQTKNKSKQIFLQSAGTSFINFEIINGHRYIIITTKSSYGQSAMGISICHDVSCCKGK